MPMDLSRYPPDWPEISRRVRERAGNQCEWCGAHNGAIGYREYDGSFIEECPNVAQDVKIIRIVLTVAHLGADLPNGMPGDKHEKRDVRTENLSALCQKCHLDFDREDHMRQARKTRNRKRGQMELEI